MLLSIAHHEAESAALRAWLLARLADEAWVSSALAEVEIAVLSSSEARGPVFVEGAVHLAVTLVQWFVADLGRRTPQAPHPQADAFSVFEIE
ncbi:hypothetical protein [Streptomyces sp. NBC_00286]|uniref:hypothetical protein n=1 Tax=Streptomyces sp. NBC_00286 TaxID=2975701 RepID=UPI002E284795|nr:hypothetical protein [Streptomyces sp. NBC_00286]